MKSALDVSKVSTLETELLQNLDERVFFGKLSIFLQDLFNEYKVQVFEAYPDGASELVAENGEEIHNGIFYQKGQGLAGYVIRTKRAYYSNSPRDPLLASTKRDDCVHSEICVPLISEGAIIGTVNIQSKDEDRKFSEDDITVVNELTEKLKSPLNNIRLYLIAKNLNRELELKIKEKEEELLHRGPSVNKTSQSLGKIEMVGTSHAFLEIVNIAKKVAKEDFPVHISGEAGTGKKMLAKKIHSISERKESSCLTVHCASIDEKQLELELFGSTQRPGAIQRANGGTLILNGVEHMTEASQRKLLRFLVSGELYNIDSSAPLPVNVRMITTTKADIAKLADEGEFNEELLYRLNIMSIKMPSLRERKDDVKILSEKFINEMSKNSGKMLTNKAVDKLKAYSWPGNIHELKNLMERTAILVSEQFIDEAHLPELEAEIEVQEEVIEDFSEMTLHDLERIHICKTLDHLGGNKTRAAKSLGITVKTLYNKLHSYGLVNPKSE
ncbi:MAG: hypothetical protein CME62_10655 [Halobacteriovoraceae bacterium]|nr:hypothetical protein [Halobacteriovoraceae bacterium]|tara:strand:- start:22775 stop:24274 length:1500 start_codon:yes stop_codon:yes gene_type:complete